MITLQRITTADGKLYAFLEGLMTRSFPSDEYRDLDELRDFTDHRPHFYNNVVLNDGTPIGLLSYWNTSTSATTPSPTPCSTCWPKRLPKG